MKTIGIRTQKRAKINLVSSGRYKFLSTKKVLYSNSPIIISKTLSKASSTLPNGSWNKRKYVQTTDQKLVSDIIQTVYPETKSLATTSDQTSDLALGKVYVWHGSTSLYPHTTGTDRVRICTKVWSLFVINSLNLRMCVTYLVFIKK